VGIAPLVQAAGAGVVTEGVPEKLAAVIQELLLDPARRLAMGRRGAAMARAQLSWDGIVDSTERLYREML
jgi:glycosyltransferase involved in cell wall biosynthesis